MLKLQHIGKVYRTSDVETHALEDVSFEVAAGEFLAIMGPSGCGESTLRNILGLRDSLTVLRRAAVGFIFQSFNLIDDLTVAENVEIALIYRRVPGTERRRRIREALELVGIERRARHRPQQLSGGQQQRVAIARALASRPKLVLADEPTGNLDSSNGDAVMGLLRAVSQGGTTVVMVTHSLAYAAAAQRTVKLLDGRVVSETLLAA